MPLPKVLQMTTYTEVQLTFYEEGKEGVQRLVASGTSPRILRKALRSMKEKNPENAEKLEDVLGELGLEWDGPGPKLPQVGDARTYRAQQQDKHLSIRLPVHTLVDVRGADVEARFEDGRIIVEKV